MMCPLVTKMYHKSDVDARGYETDEVMYFTCQQEGCALWAKEVKGRSVAGCSIALGAASLLAIAAMLEKNLEKK